ncbi:MAG: hypothetical protein U1E65_02930 [Myxococcota bacterium]
MRARTRGHGLRLAGALVALLPSSGAWGWGDQAHALVAGAAYNLLENQCLSELYYANDQALIQAALDPDAWRDTDPDEGARHFLDIDAIRVPANFPHDLDVAIAQFGRDAVYQNGTVPWVAESFYAQLVAAFRAINAGRAVALSGNLSHYVSDAYSPYHATINFDGQATGNPGIHLRYEADMVDANAAAVQRGIAARAQRVSAPSVLRDEIFSALLSGTALVAGINQVDVQARGSISALWSAKGPEAMDRMAAGADLTAALWEQAYAEAGAPILPGMSPGCAGSQAPDAGEPQEDAGTEPDTGVEADAGAASDDAGVGAMDAQASTADDAGTSDPTPSANRGSSGCSATGDHSAIWAILGLGLFAWRAKRQRRG